MHPWRRIDRDEVFRSIDDGRGGRSGTDWIGANIRVANARRSKLAPDRERDFFGRAGVETAHYGQWERGAARRFERPRGLHAPAPHEGPHGGRSARAVAGIRSQDHYPRRLADTDRHVAEPENG